jgi:sugar phosphate isomerase/epimerase
MNIACGYTVPITLYGIPPKPEDHLKAMDEIGTAGFNVVELELYDELIPEHQRDLPKMKEILKKHNQKIASIMAVEEHMFSIDPKIKEKAIKDFNTITDMIVELGCPIVEICGYMPPEIRPKDTALYVGGPSTAVIVNDDFSWQVFWENAVDLITQCAKIAGRKGLIFSIETRANDVFSSTDALMRLIDRVQENLKKENLSCEMGVTYDVAHVHAGKEYLSLVTLKLGSLIKLVHLSDNDGSFAYHYQPNEGNGNIDFPMLFKQLKQIGYDGTLVVDTVGGKDPIRAAVKARKYYQSLMG